MLAANKETLSNFFSASSQYVVPFFQRAYVWGEDNWTTFWEHLQSILKLAESGKDGEHFIGTIIAKQIPAQMIGESKYDLIDGQQRLTTVAILLKAIAATSSGTLPNLKGAIEQRLSFRDTRNAQFPRIVPSKNDQPYFRAVVLDGTDELGNLEHPILKAYAYFSNALTGYSDDRLDLLQRVLLNRVPVICMMLSAEDDEQEIFDTINALGVRLTTGELLKNYIFKNKKLQPHYDTLWSSVFEGDDDQVTFWGESKTAGRITRTNLEVLLYCFLIIQTGVEVKLETLFKEYKRWLENKSNDDLVTFLKELKACATIYFDLPAESDLNEISFAESEKRFFHVVENLVVTTVYPLVLYLYTTVKDEEERLTLLGLLENFIVRRNVCRLTTKNYNLLFVQIMNQLREIEKEGHDITAASLRAILEGFDDPTNSMPSDDEFARAFHSSALSNQNSREILFLLALYQVSTGLADKSRLSLGTYSTEHMMPVKWEENWPAKFNADRKAARNAALKTLGNLTLVTKRLNSAMQNSAWSTKKEYLRPNSSLSLTSKYLALKSWDEVAIGKRADDLAADALKIWEGIR